MIYSFQNSWSGWLDLNQRSPDSESGRLNQTFPHPGIMVVLVKSLAATQLLSSFYFNIVYNIIIDVNTKFYDHH